MQKTFLEHVQELRKRLLICVITVISAGILGYALQDRLLTIIQKPLGKVLFYTSPAGGFNFIFTLCVLFGLIIALPVIVYQFIKFIEPTVYRLPKKAIAVFIFFSCLLAILGLVFAYFFSLPAALHFLSNFGGPNIQSLITAESYFSFASKYLLGFALLFQLPLIILFINRIKPLRPSKLLGYSRYVILGSFITAAIITPTPDPLNQLLMAVPILVLYFLSVFLLAIVNLGKKDLPRVIPTYIASVQSLPPPSQIAYINSPSQPEAVTRKTGYVMDMVKPLRASTLEQSTNKAVIFDNPNSDNPYWHFRSIGHRPKQYLDIIVQ